LAIRAAIPGNILIGNALAGVVSVWSAIRKLSTWLCCRQTVEMDRGSDFGAKVTPTIATDNRNYRAMRGGVYSDPWRERYVIL
jgi:hypothetical protein